MQALVGSIYLRKLSHFIAYLYSKTLLFSNQKTCKM